MPLVTNPDQSHDFYLPATPNIVRDIDNFLQPRQTLPPVHAIGTIDWDIQQIAPGFGYYRLTLYEPRGRYRQRADFSEGHNMQADGDLVGDDQGVLRHAFLTKSIAAPSPVAPYGTRFCGADFGGKMVLSVAVPGTASLYADSGAYEPSIAAVAGYTPEAGQTAALCMKAVDMAGSPRLLRGFVTGTASTIQCLSDLNNPPTSTTLAAGATGSTYGFEQTPVDNHSILAYVGTNMKVWNANVVPGAETVQTRAYVPLGGYMVGMIAFGHNPEIFIVVPKDGYPTLLGYVTPVSWRGKILKLDLRALTVSDFETNFLSHVKWATAMPNAMFMCNEEDHYYVTNGANLPVDLASDRLANSNVQRICMGHVPFGHKCLYYINDVHYDLSVTVRYVMEFDSLTRTVQQVSKSVSLLSTGRLSDGGANMPRSNYNGHIYDLIHEAAPRWLVQYQPEASEVGYNARKTAGGPAGYGREFELTGYRRTPKMSLPGHPRAVMTVAAITGPTRASLLTGDASDGNHDSRLEITTTGTPLAGFRSADPVERRGVRAFPGNNSWFPELELLVTSYRGTGGTDETRYTPDVYPITVEGFWREQSLPVPAKEIYERWNQSE